MLNFWGGGGRKKLARASKILTQINRVPRHQNCSVTQNRALIYCGLNMEFKKLCKDVNMDFSDFNLEGYESNFLDGERSSKPSVLLFHILPNRK